jgi:hypothetical protein
MQLLGAFTEAHLKVLTDTRRCLATINRLSATPCATAEEGISILDRLRRESYEDLNQIQHEHLIVRAAEWLETDAQHEVGMEWGWNPRQTGDSSEPDLRGSVRSTVVVSAEITTSERPVGTIDKRMQSTLSKLAQMSGRKYYFVRTEAMCMRAETKVKKAGWPISVVRLSVWRAKRAP